MNGGVNKDSIVILITPFKDFIFKFMWYTFIYYTQLDFMKGCIFGVITAYSNDGYFMHHKKSNFKVKSYIWKSIFPTCLSKIKVCNFY